MARERKQAGQSFTAMYSRCERGYMGQLLEWPEVVTEGKSIDECRELLQDALQEMIAAHREIGKDIVYSGYAT
jgi:predicted RNase H-like HicB family nuclease